MTHIILSIRKLGNYLSTQTISDFNDFSRTESWNKKQIFLAGWYYWAHSARYGIIIAVGIRTPVSWGMTSCSLADGYHHFYKPVFTIQDRATWFHWYHTYQATWCQTWRPYSWHYMHNSSPLHTTVSHSLCTVKENFWRCLTIKSSSWLMSLMRNWT